MADLNLAVRELLDQEFKDLRQQVKELQETKCAELEKGLQELSSAAKLREEETKELRGDVDQQKKALQEGLERTGALEGFKADAADLKEHFSQRGEEFARLRERMEAMEQELEKVRPRLEENGRIVQAAKDRTEEFGLNLKTFDRQCSGLQTSVDAFREELRLVVERCDTVTTAQEASDDMVARKYEKLWQDVLHAVEELKDSQLELLRKDIDCRYVDAKREVKGIVSYALNLIETVHVERRNKSLCKSLVTAWQEQSWHSARRRVGLYWLRNLVFRKHREVLVQWRQQKDVGNMFIRLRKDILPKIPDVELVLERIGLERRCDTLDLTVSELRAEKCSQQQLDDRLQEQASAVELRFEAFADVKPRLAGHDGDIAKAAECGRKRDERLDGCDGRFTDFEEQLANSQQRLLEFATSKEVQGMMRDVLLIWNSIKVLDAAKADKKDFEGFAVDSENRDRLSTRKIEGLEGGVAQRAREEALRTQERWSEIGQRLDDNSQQFRKWEDLWEKLSGFVEDLVQKVSDLQAAEVSSGPGGRPPLAGTPSSRARSISREPLPLVGSAGMALARSRSDVPRSDVPRCQGGLDRSLETAGGVAAKAMVDATIDQVLGQKHMSPKASGPPRPGRPRSAPRTGVVRVQ